MRCHKCNLNSTCLYEVRPAEGPQSTLLFWHTIYALAQRHPTAPTLNTEADLKYSSRMRCHLYGFYKETGLRICYSEYVACKHVFDDNLRTAFNLDEKYWPTFASTPSITGHLADFLKDAARFLGKFKLPAASKNDGMSSAPTTLYSSVLLEIQQPPDAALSPDKSCNQPPLKRRGSLRATTNRPDYVSPDPKQIEMAAFQDRCLAFSDKNGDRKRNPANHTRHFRPTFDQGTRLIGMHVIHKGEERIVHEIGVCRSHTVEQHYVAFLRSPGKAPTANFSLYEDKSFVECDTAL